METNNAVEKKSKSFALRIIRLYRYLCNEKKEFILSRQMLRSGTSIGANVKEGIFGQTRADFLSKMTIALKETSETEYWLELLHESGYLNDQEFCSIYHDCKELLRLLIVIVKSTKAKQNSAG